MRRLAKERQHAAGQPVDTRLVAGIEQKDTVGDQLGLREPIARFFRLDQGSDQIVLGLGAAFRLLDRICNGHEIGDQIVLGLGAAFSHQFTQQRREIDDRLLGGGGLFVTVVDLIHLDNRGRPGP